MTTSTAPAHRRFILYRDTDVSGVSGTGIVAEGVVFSNGRAVIHWIVGEHRSTVIWESIESVDAIHGHNGATRIEWIDGEAAEPAPIAAAPEPVDWHARARYTLRSLSAREFDTLDELLADVADDAFIRARRRTWSAAAVKHTPGMYRHDTRKGEQ